MHSAGSHAGVESTLLDRRPDHDLAARARHDVAARGVHGLRGERRLSSPQPQDLALHRAYPRLGAWAEPAQPSAPAAGGHDDVARSNRSSRCRDAGDATAPLLHRGRVRSRRRSRRRSLHCRAQSADQGARLDLMVLRGANAARDTGSQPRLEPAALTPRDPVDVQSKRLLELEQAPELLGVVAIHRNDQRAPPLVSGGHAQRSRSASSNCGQRAERVHSRFSRRSGSSPKLVSVTGASIPELLHPTRRRRAPPGRGRPLHACLRDAPGARKADHPGADLDHHLVLASACHLRASFAGRRPRHLPTPALPGTGSTVGGGQPPSQPGSARSSRAPMVPGAGGREPAPASSGRGTGPARRSGRQGSAAC